MPELSPQLIYTFLVFLGVFVTRFLLFSLLDRIKSHLKHQNLRAKMIKKFINLIFTILVIVSLLVIWGVKKDEILIFISSILTIIGIAFVAQWSILSNITATIILFINHPITIGDEIRILDKDNEVEGVVKDFGLFFVTVKTKNKELVSVPSTLFIQKMVARTFKKSISAESSLDEKMD